MVTPGGHQMSVAMTNCGSAGWVTDRSGYRYVASDPRDGKAMAGDAALVSRSGAGAPATAAGFGGFAPDACLINRYQPGARMSLHQDRDEHDFGAADRIGVAGPAGDFPVRRTEAQRQAAARFAWSTAISWCGAARRGLPFTASRRSPKATMRSPAPAASTSPSAARVKLPQPCP